MLMLLLRTSFQYMKKNPLFPPLEFCETHSRFGEFHTLLGQGEWVSGSCQVLYRNLPNKHKEIPSFQMINLLKQDLLSIVEIKPYTHSISIYIHIYIILQNLQSILKNRRIGAVQSALRNGPTHREQWKSHFHDCTYSYEQS